MNKTELEKIKCTEEMLQGLIKVCEQGASVTLTEDVSRYVVKTYSELLAFAEKARDVIEFYSKEPEWRERKVKEYMWNDEETGEPYYMERTRRTRLACHGIVRAREFKNSAEWKRVFGGEKE